MSSRTHRAGRAGLAALAALALPLAAPPAGATAPCFDVCHLGQGQPLLLRDSGTLWVRRCTAAKPGVHGTCVLERIAASGRVHEQVPLERSYDEDAFEDAHLRGHTVVGLHHQSAWTDLKQPYTLEPYRAPGVTLRFDGDALVCTPAKAKGPVVRRPLGCTPKSVYVFAAGIGRDSQPEDPTGTVAVVATCAAAGGGTREAVAICRPLRR